MEDYQIKSDDLIGYLETESIPYVDKRGNGGSLWIIGGKELAAAVSKAKQLGYTFHFKKEGGKATKGQSGWWTK